MEINPNLLIIIAVTAVIGFVVSSFLRPAGKPEKASRASKYSEAQPAAVPVAAASSSAVESAASKPKKKKNRSKKSKKGSDESDTGAESANEKKEETPVVKFEETNTKKKGTKAAAAPAPSALKKPEAAPVKAEESDSDSDSSDDEEVRKPVPAKKAPSAVIVAAKRAALDDVAPIPTVVQSHFDGWNVVEDKRKNKPKKEEAVSPVVEKPVAAAAAAPEPVTPPAPVVETITAEVKADAKKLGLLIGPKGATRIAIQNATATNIQMPKADKETTGPVVITVSGPELGVRKAVQALNELCAKGYCGLLAPDDFQESYVAVHTKFLKDIIGPKGDVIKKLGTHTGVKITVPETLKTPGPDGKIPKIKIGLTGQKDKVNLARTLIKDITKYFHTPVTHPGIVHVDMDIPSTYYNFIIGAKGAEIKNIQNTHKVTVHIPDEESPNPNVVVVGEPNNVAQAKAHIEKLITRVDERAAAAAAAKAEAAGVSAVPAEPVQAPPASVGGVAIGATVGGGPGWNTNNARKAPKVVEEAEEEWVKEFAPQSSINIDINSIISDNHKFAPAVVPAAVAPVGISIPAPVEKKLVAPSSAWNNLSGLSAENWN